MGLGMGHSLARPPHKKAQKDGTQKAQNSLEMLVPFVGLLLCLFIAQVRLRSSDG
jgi:hypothetical protein